MAEKTIYPFNLMIKPIGSACNLACEYCYYLDKSEMYAGAPSRMDDATLDRVTSAYLKIHPGPEVTFGWQGGEPLLMGREFFERALELQSKYAQSDQRVSNALQTNGVLVDDEWAEFFARHNFLIGISIDGPADLHDQHRRDRGGKPSYSKVVNGIRALQRHGVEYNALVTVNRTNVDFPLRVYFHLVELGIRFLQFIPIVEHKSSDSLEVTDWSVPADGYGTFLSTIFDYWSQFDVGRVFVQQFESALSVWAGFPPSVCVFARTCGRSLVVERNGDLYACDHFVYPEYLRGSVTPDTLEMLIDSPLQHAFGESKADLSSECIHCDVLHLCEGDCPKHRISVTENGKRISYLCPSYREFFTYSAPVLQSIASRILSESEQH